MRCGAGVIVVSVHSRGRGVGQLWGLAPLLLEFMCMHVYIDTIVPHVRKKW